MPFHSCGKEERDVKSNVSYLLNYLKGDNNFPVNIKEGLVLLCEKIINGEELYSKSEKGRKEEANFQIKEDVYFQVYMLSLAKIDQNRIIDLVPRIGDVRNIQRAKLRVKERTNDEHFYKICGGYFERYYCELIKRSNITISECEKVERFLESITDWTTIADGPTCMKLVLRKKLPYTEEEEKIRFLAGLIETRNFYINRRTSNKF